MPRGIGPENRTKPERYTVVSASFRSFAGLFRLRFHTQQDQEWGKRKMTVSVQEVTRVAELAHLELKPEESGRMLKDLNAILDYVAELNELDTTGVEPLAQVSELLDASFGSGLRADVQRPSLDRSVVLAQAPESDPTCFRVPKVIER